MFLFAQTRVWRPGYPHLFLQSLVILGFSLLKFKSGHRMLSPMHPFYEANWLPPTLYCTFSHRRIDSLPKLTKIAEQPNSHSPRSHRIRIRKSTSYLCAHDCMFLYQKLRAKQLGGPETDKRKRVTRKADGKLTESWRKADAFGEFRGVLAREAGASVYPSQLTHFSLPTSGPLNSTARPHRPDRRPHEQHRGCQRFFTTASSLFRFRCFCSTKLITLACVDHFVCLDEMTISWDDHEQHRGAARAKLVPHL